MRVTTEAKYRAESSCPGGPSRRTGCRRSAEEKDRGAWGLAEKSLGVIEFTRKINIRRFSSHQADSRARCTEHRVC